MSQTPANTSDSMPNSSRLVCWRNCGKDCQKLDLGVVNRWYSATERMTATVSPS